MKTGSNDLMNDQLKQKAEREVTPSTVHTLFIDSAEQENINEMYKRLRIGCNKIMQ